MTTHVLFFYIFFEKDLHLNATENKLSTNENRKSKLLLIDSIQNCFFVLPFLIEKASLC